MKKNKFLAFALFAVLACLSFASCSDDDKEDSPSEDFIGMWQESWYDDYVNLGSDGTGFWSEGPNPTAEDYNEGWAVRIKWSYVDEWFTIIDVEENECMFKGRVVTKAADKIIFREYACDEGGNLDVEKPTSGKYTSEDSYGYYEVVTFNRYK